MSLELALAALRQANRIDGTRASYRKDNPAEYVKVMAYLDGAARPVGADAFSFMGQGLVWVEDHRRAEVVTPPPPPPPTTFDKYASPSGSDSNSGSLTSPYRSLQKLADSLAPGQVGAMHGGSYSGAQFTKPGTVGSRLRITAYPGEKPVVSGRIIMDAAYVTLDNLELNGPFTAYRTGLILDHCDIHGSPGSGVYLGDSGAGCTDSVIRYCRLHDYGSNAHYDHGVYMDNGNNIEVHHNWIWGGAHGWGVQLYDSPTNCRVHHNVIDRCGAGFVYSANAANNLVSNNVISNCVQMYDGGGGAVPRAALYGYPPDGVGNAFNNNCSFQNAGGIGGQMNVSMSGNFTADPLFVDAANHDYSVKAGSPLAAWGLWDGK